MWTQCCDCLTGLSCIFFEHLLRSKSGICRTPNWTWRIIAELSREKRSNMGNKICLSVHPRNFGSDKFVRRYVHPFTLTDVKCHTYQPVVEGSYNLYQTWYYGQLTAVKKEHPLTSVTWLYRGLRCTTDWADLFWKFSAVVFQFIAGLGHFLFQEKFSLFLAYGKSWITAERHLLKDPTRASLLALAKSIYYLFAGVWRTVLWWMLEW